MKQKTDIPEHLYTDEAVCFIAGRHKVTPQQLLHHFLAGKPSGGEADGEGASIALEPNEMEILNGLSGRAGRS